MKKENPSAFKHWINPEVVKKIGRAIQGVHPTFDVKLFSQISSKLDPLELKPRVQLIRDHLFKTLPGPYPKSLSLLLKAVEKSSLSGFELWPITEFVQTYGLNHFDESMNALYILTQKFTSEFAVRPFLIQDRKKTFSLLQKWYLDNNVHVRRWLSEGTRPRLPWGIKLQDSISDPTPGIKILDLLKNDDELYVRKSVANHLNDITKDHPDLVIATLKRWKKEASPDQLKNLDWIQRHSLRTLIKAGYKPALNLMGYGGKPVLKIQSLKLNKNKFKIKDTLTFEIQIKSLATREQKLAIDYVIQYQKANGQLSPKVFKMKVFTLKAKESIVLIKNHSLKPVTTRKHYPGLHRLEIQLNGHILATADWRLSI